MQSGIAESVRPLFSRNGTPNTPEEMSLEWTCKKRDGTVVKFDIAKIRVALKKCFFNFRVEYNTLIEKLILSVCNTLLAQRKTSPEVEEIQRLVIQQLWSEGLFDAAESYQNYREERRKARLTETISPEYAAAVAEDQKHFPTPIQYYQFLGKFSRWRDDLKRRETWKETVYDRVCPWLFKQVPGKLTDEEKLELSSSMYNFETSPAMRVVQMAGPALDRCQVGVFNFAALAFDDLFSFAELLYILMQGTGCSFSVESDYVSCLPRIKKQRGLSPITIVVEDDTEGWCNSYYEILKLLFDGYDIKLDTHKVRPANTRLKTKGGRSGGPGPFIELINFARTLILSKQGRCLEDIDAHDLGCMTGRIVQVGGVRRAACLSHSDLTSLAMRQAKFGPWYNTHKQRTMANNAAVYNFDGQPPIGLFMEEWLSLMNSGSGERSIFNRAGIEKHKPARRKSANWLTNPCAEINFKPDSFCNLSMTIARHYDSVASLMKKVRLATIWGLIQSTCTKFNFISATWQKNAEEERLLGVDITGQADCPLLRYGAPNRGELIRELKQVVYRTKMEYAPRFGINISAADTCVKPGGDSSVAFNCSSGISARFSEYQTRWVREPKESPISRFMLDSGVPHAPAPEAPGELLVFGFPQKAPEGATLRNDMTAIEQFYNWLDWKQNWAEHSVSATIYVEEHEWLELGALVYKHFDEVSGLSFFPKNNGIYSYAPNEELTKEQYDKAKASFPELNWAKMCHYEKDDMTQGSQVLACTGDTCSF